MPEKIPSSAELRFIKIAASGRVHIYVKYAAWDNPYATDERIPISGDGTAVAELLGQPTITRCGLRTWPSVFNIWMTSPRPRTGCWWRSE